LAVVSTQSVRNAANYIAKKDERAFVTRVVAKDGATVVRVWRVA
jgi:hypothetical protein